jgi:hypothetical protein
MLNLRFSSKFSCSQLSIPSIPSPGTWAGLSQISVGEFEAGGSSQVSFNVLKSFKFNVLYNCFNIIY